MAANKDPAVAAALRVPDAEIYAIDVSFPALKDKAEFEYLNQQPTSFVLPPEAVDRLRAAAGTIILDSPEFKRLLKDVGANDGRRSATIGTATWRTSGAWARRTRPVSTRQVVMGYPTREGVRSLRAPARDHGRRPLEETSR